MRAMFPEAASSSLPRRLGLIAAIGNGGTPKLRRGGHVGFAALCAMAHRPSEIVSTSAGCRGRAPRIEATQCDEVSGLDAPLSDSSCGITIELSAPRDELLGGHFIHLGCARAIC